MQRMKLLIISEKIQSKINSCKKLFEDKFCLTFKNKDNDIMSYIFSQKPDVLLCDMDTDGINIAQRLRKLFKPYEVSMIFVLGNKKLSYSSLFENFYGDILCTNAAPEEILRRLESVVNNLVFHRRLIKKQKHLENLLSKLSQICNERDQELFESRKVQHRLLPRGTPDNIEYKVKYFIKSANILCGDYVDVFRINNQNIAVILIDVSGSGAPSAVITGMVHGWFHANLKTNKSLKSLLKDFNLYLYEHTLPEMYVAGFIGIINLSTNRLEYVLAGCPYPIVHRNSSTFTISNTRKSSPLGLEKEYNPNILYYIFEPETSMLIFSDGFLDILPKNGDEYFFLEELFEKYSLKENMPELRHILDGILPDTKSLKDDITLLFLQRKAQTEPKKIKILTLHQNWYEFAITSEEESVIELQRFLKDLLKDILDEELFWDICMIISELTWNAIEWGNKFDIHKIVLISIKITEDAVIIKIEDEGSGFNVVEALKKADNSRIDTDIRPGGFGLALAKYICDSIIFNNRGNIVILNIKKK